MSFCVRARKCVLLAFMLAVHTTKLFRGNVLRAPSVPNPEFAAARGSVGLTLWLQNFRLCGRKERVYKFGHIIICIVADGPNHFDQFFGNVTSRFVFVLPSPHLQRKNCGAYTVFSDASKIFPHMAVNVKP